MEITWEFNDGYAGGSRPQYLTIDDEELNECEALSEKTMLIDEYIREEIIDKGYSVIDCDDKDLLNEIIY